MPKLYPPFFTLNGAVVRELLARSHRTREDLAVELGVTAGYASQLLNQRRLLSPKLRRRILESTLFEGVPESDIWTEVAGEPTPSAPKGNGR